MPNSCLVQATVLWQPPSSLMKESTGKMHKGSAQRSKAMMFLGRKMFLPKQVLVGVRNTTYLRVGPPLSPFVSVEAIAERKLQ